MIFNCPGSQKFKEPFPENIDCRHCGYAIEIWTDERSALCPKCGREAGRVKEGSCLDWCTHAALCAGYKVVAGNK